MEYKARTFQLPDNIKGLSKKQVDLHLGLYEGYVKHVNLLVEQMTALAKSKEDFSYALAELRRRLGFEWNGMHLHEIYFGALENGASPLLADTKLYKALLKQYGGLTEWLDVFKKVSARGPGWAILNYDVEMKHFLHTWVADHEVGQLATLPAIVAIDHWEHAYLVDYKPSEKGAYIDAYLNALNWEIVANRFEHLL